MAGKIPAPRVGSFYGMPIISCVMSDGTWLEGEEFAYPDGGMTRRALANCSDGKRRVVRCGIPDSAWTLPAYARINGKYTRGYLTADNESGVVFNECNK